MDNELIQFFTEVHFIWIKGIILTYEVESVKDQKGIRPNQNKMRCIPFLKV